MRRRVCKRNAARRRRQWRRRAVARFGVSVSVGLRGATGESAALELGANLAARVFLAVNIDVKFACLVSRVLGLGQLGVRGWGELVVAGLGEWNDHRAVGAGRAFMNVRRGSGH